MKCPNCGREMKVNAGSWTDKNDGSRNISYKCEFCGYVVSVKE